MAARHKRKWLRRTLLTAIAIAVAGGIGFAVWRLWIHPVVAISIVEYPIRGIDVSAHNGDIDFSRVRDDSISFVYIKATEGVSFVDSTFERNYERALTAGIPVGAYHFFRFDMNGTLQAKHLLRNISGKVFDLPLVIDVEQHGNPEVVTGSVLFRLRDMVDYLRIVNPNIIIYTNANGYERFYQGNFEDCDLWICRFRQLDPNLPWLMWQYSHWGSVTGVEGDVDLDVFNGQQAAFERLLGDYSY